MRSLLGRDLFYDREVEVPCVSLGIRGDPWYVALDGLGPDSTVYSFGVGEDVSFELELVARIGARIHVFDPTPRSLAWMRTQDFPDKLCVHPLGIASWDGEADFSPPADASHVSYSMVRSASASARIVAPVRRLETIAGRLGHRSIDLLKMDIEGAEYDVIPDILASSLSVRQLLVEFHHRWAGIGARATRVAVKALRAQGYRIARVSPSGCEFTFLGRSWGA